jgi:phosphate transport system ATP-binding protein
MSAQFHLSSENVNVWFGERHVLKDVSLQFPTNQVTALIGPSGCGKSTFIRTLNRMHELIPGAGFGGKVLLDGQDIYEEFSRSQIRSQQCRSKRTYSRV